MSLLIGNSNFGSSVTNKDWKYYNVAAYILNVVFTFGIGVFGWFGLASNRDISERYVSLIAPAGWAFSIWSVIFLAQAVFVVVQSGVIQQFPVENNPLVKEGVGVYYIGVCGVQALWSLCFSSDFIFLALLLIAAIAALLVEIVRKQYNIVEDVDKNGEGSSTATENNNKKNRYQPRWLEYLLLQFPFAIHCGWILVATFVNLNVWLVKVNAGVSLQRNTALFSLLALVLIAILYLSLYNTELVVPVVFAWAAFGIFSELQTPNGQLFARFEEETITFYQSCAIVAAIAILMGVVGKAIVTYFIQTCRGKSDNVNDEYQKENDNDGGVIA